MKTVKRTIEINEVKVEIVAGSDVDALLSYVEGNMEGEQVNESLELLKNSKKALIKSPFGKNQYFLNIKGKSTYLGVCENVLSELDKNDDVRRSLDDNRNEIRMRDRLCLIVKDFYKDLLLWAIRYSIEEKALFFNAFFYV